MHLKTELGKNIKKYRKLNNMTQERLAEVIGVEINSISAIETGKYFPTPENLTKIASALNVSFSDLFTFFQSSNPLDEILKNLDLLKNDKIKLNAINAFIKHIL